MSKNNSSSLRNHNERLDYFQARLTAQLLVVFITIALGIQRLIIVFTGATLTPEAEKLLIISCPFLLAMALVVIFKYILFRRMGVRMLKYSDLIDFIFTLVFTGEWLVLVMEYFEMKTEQSCYGLPILVSVGLSSWRTLLQILISRYWQVRIIGPTVITIYMLQLAVKQYPSQAKYFLPAGFSQWIFTVLIFYFEHRLNFILTIGNVPQEQWLRLNEFMLNNLPESIAILDKNGKCKFISDNLKRLITHYTQSQNRTEVEQFFQKVKDLQQMPQDIESDSDSSTDLHTLETLLPTSTHLDSGFEANELESLESLLSIFSVRISQGKVKEKSLYIFNSKFTQDDDESTQERSIQINISFINQHPHKYILLVLRDTTQRDLILTLQDNLKYKDHLLASVSHELRTPLNGNINLIEAAIRSKDICDKIKDTLLIPAVKSSKFLLYLVNDILDLYQIKAQKLRLAFQQASLKETLTNTLQLLELHAKKKGIRLEIDIDPNIPEMFCTDHARLSQIILNLMNNSIKFTQSGFVKLSAWPMPNTASIKVSVEDSGVGMTQEDIGKLFKDFTHIDSKDHAMLNPTGVGLGLKIANDLSQLLGPNGNKGIIVESILNKGSVFSFIVENKETGLGSQRNKEFRPEEEPKEDVSLVIPNEFNIANEASLEIKITHINSMWSLPRLTMDTRSMPSLPLSCSCSKVLVVDDDSFNIMAYEVILDSLGVRYESEYNGRSAIDKMLNKVRYPCSLNCHPYKIVFMDEEMPGMNGRQTVTEICNLQKQGLLPQMDIIGCTAHHDKEHIEEFLKSGIVEYMPKPISFDAIKRVLRKYDK